MIFLIILGVTEIFCIFRLVLEGTAGKEILESSRLELLEKFLAYLCWERYWQFAKNLEKPSVWEVILFCFIQAYASLAASRTLSQQLIACLNILSLQTKKVISMNYGSSTNSWKPWRWMRLDLTLTMRDIYISSNLNPLTKFTSSNPLMEHLSNDHEDSLNQHDNNHKLCDEMGHPIGNLMKSQGKLRQQHDENFPMEGRPL